jgi:hypothetical protein
VAIDHAANAAGRLAGKELLKFANDEPTIAQLKTVRQKRGHRVHLGVGEQHTLTDGWDFLELT